MTRPNIVVVSCDDLGYGDLGCYGATYETPNIDDLATSGVRFEDWHSTAPVCSPSRASLLTGRYPPRAGVPRNIASKRPREQAQPGLPPEQRTLADRLGESGYRTSAFGKWHLGMRAKSRPMAQGFEKFFGFLSGCVDYYSHQFVWRSDVAPYHDLWEDGYEVWHNGEYLTHLITDRAVDAIDAGVDDERPFFTYIAYNAPHYPMHVPETYLERFPELPPDRRVFAAMVAAVDDGVGRILDTLRERGVYEETLVVFTSDHGPSREVRNHMDGSDEPYLGGRTGGLRGHKMSLFEGGIRVPAIVSNPGEIDGGDASSALTMSIDLVPTILEACEMAVPDGLDGVSLWPLLTEDATPSRDRLYWEFNEQLAVRDGDWKLVCNGHDLFGDPNPVHLSNLESDPGEEHNRADEQPKLARELRADGRAWAATVGGESA